MINDRSPGRTQLEPELAGVLLAGGMSRRMGCDKALLRVGGRPLVQHLAAQLRKLTDLVLLSTNNQQAFSFLDLPIVPDLFPGRGPLAGLHAALLMSSRPWLIVLACDLPLVDAAFLRKLASGREGFDAVVPVTSDGRLHPACAVYSRRCLPLVEQSLASGEYKMIRLLGHPRLHIRRLSPNQGEFADTLLMDLNSPEDYAEYLRLFEA